MPYLANAITILNNNIMTIKQKVQQQALIGAQNALDNFTYAERKLEQAQEAFDKAKAEYENALQNCKDEEVEFTPLKWEE